MIQSSDLNTNVVLTVQFYSQLTPEKKDEFWKSELGLILEKSYIFNRQSLDYYREYGDGVWVDNTIIVYNGDAPLICIPSIDQFGKLGFSGGATQIFSVCDQMLSERCKDLFSNWLKSEKNSVIKSAYLRLDEQFLELCFSQLYKDKNTYITSIDLTGPTSEIFKKFRKGHRHAIRKADKFFETKIMDHNRADLRLFTDFQNLHATASGRKTRSDRSWMLQYEMIQQDNAFLVTSHDKENNLVSGIYIMIGADEAFYGVAASAKSLMTKKIPCNHLALYRAIEFAKFKNIQKFILGEIWVDSDDRKLKSIAGFKKGFASCIDINTDLFFKFGN